MARRKKVEPTQEELQQQALQRELKDLMDKIDLIPEPTYHLENGQEVTIGALEDVVVVNSLEGGKIYEVDYTSVNNNYGNPIRNEHQRRYVKWLDIRKRNDNKESFEQNQDIRLSYSQRSIDDLLGKAYHFGIDFDVDYQRDYVWTLEDKVKLIDSIFNNVDIGKFVFIRRDYSEEVLFEPLDGKQRTRAILDYYEDRFQYKGKYFSELSEGDQSHIERYSISMAEVWDLTQEQILRYFINLNSGGKVMSQEHLNKVIQMLHEIESK